MNEGPANRLNIWKESSKNISDRFLSKHYAEKPEKL